MTDFARGLQFTACWETIFFMVERVMISYMVRWRHYFTWKWLITCMGNNGNDSFSDISPWEVQKRFF